MVRPFLALYVGGMGAGRNFHFDVIARMGYERAALEGYARNTRTDFRARLANKLLAYLPELAASAALRRLTHLPPPQAIKHFSACAGVGPTADISPSLRPMNGRITSCSTVPSMMTMSRASDQFLTQKTSSRSGASNDGLSRLDLPQAGDARPHAMTLAEGVGELVDLAPQRRTRSDEAHVAAHYIDWLGQLVEAGRLARNDRHA